MATSPVIDGEAQARDYMARLRGQQTHPDELAVIVSMLYGPRLKGFCRVLEQALAVRHA